MPDLPSALPDETAAPRPRNRRPQASSSAATPQISAAKRSPAKRNREQTFAGRQTGGVPFVSAGLDKAVGTGNISPLTEVGTTGLNVNSGYIRDNADPRFNGVQWRKTLIEMSERSSIIGGINAALTSLIRQSEWKVVAASDKPRDEANAKHVRECLEDMNQPWGSTLAEISTMFTFGWSYFEVVYKRRLGQSPPQSKDSEGNRRDRPPSRYDDNKIGWRKFAPRAQQTLHQWAIDEAGGIQGMIQNAPPSNQKRWLPIERCLLFRPLAYRNNPEGRSIFTNAYDSWYYMSRLQLSEAIGSERNLVGVPSMGVPMRIMLADAEPAEKQLFEDLGEVLASFKRDERSFLMYPLAYDKDGHPLFKFDLNTGSGGGPAADTRRMIEAHKSDIAMSALASFILTGMEGTGANNLADSRLDHFTSALKSYIEAILEVMNLYAIPRLLRLNGIKTATPPKMVVGKIRPFDLNELGTFIQRISASGAEFFPSRELEDALLDAAGLPIPADDDRPKPGEGNQVGRNPNQQPNVAPPGGQAPNPRRAPGSKPPSQQAPSTAGVGKGRGR